MKRRTKTISAAALIGCLLFGVTAPALAIDYRTGFIECYRRKAVNFYSETTRIGTPTLTFSVGHYVPNAPAQSRNKPGVFRTVHISWGGNWTVSTNGTINRGSAGCG